LVREAVQIGSILRENRMTAGVARTVAEGCHLGFPLDDACRRLMQSKREHKARLYFGVAPRHAMSTQAPRFEFIPASAAKSTRPIILCGATSWPWASTRALLIRREDSLSHLPRAEPRGHGTVGYRDPWRPRRRGSPTRDRQENFFC